MTISAEEIIAKLDLAPHPEGGYFRETYRSDIQGKNGRAACTLIYFLLTGDQRSHWHRVDGDEIWHWYGGAPLCLLVSPDQVNVETLSLGPHIFEGESPHHVVQKGVWQSAYSQGEWTLVGCTVAPGFEFKGFELAPPDWTPGRP